MLAGEWLLRLQSGPNLRHVPPVESFSNVTQQHTPRLVMTRTSESRSAGLIVNDEERLATVVRGQPFIDGLQPRRAWSPDRAPLIMQGLRNQAVPGKSEQPLEGALRCEPGPVRCHHQPRMQFLYEGGEGLPSGRVDQLHAHLSCKLSHAVLVERNSAIQDEDVVDVHEKNWIKTWRDIRTLFHSCTVTESTPERRTCTSTVPPGSRRNTIRVPGPRPRAVLNAFGSVTRPRLSITTS
jgi:hypothetical protein